jgi:alkanesulfonate monooxygenase SsuD/methylene tetrahydromethanopterin reductase-like flavin-dependent oxidoreductase (luciferase family)
VPVEFIGIARTADRSETIAETGPAVQAEYLYHLAATHEQSGFDRVLVAHSSSSPDGFIVADQVLNATSRLGVLLAHRPGFVAPTIAARKFATIDAFYPGRIALHVITGGDDGDQARDGDFTDKFAAAGDIHDKRLWTALSEATGAAGNSTALVGSYEQVAESLLDYVAVGATTLLIRGYDPLLDAAAYADLIRLVHEQVGEDIDSFRARVAA